MQIRMQLPLDAMALAARAACGAIIVIAVKDFGQLHSRQPLADAIRTGEQVSRSHALPRDVRLQQTHRRGLILNRRPRHC
jgi:hypothetical protein